MKIDADTLREWASIDSSWQLQELKKHDAVKHGTRYQVVWFTAVSADREQTRSYRVWLNEGLSPPYRRQRGWELFDADGTLLDREISYTKKDNRYLH